MRAVNTLVFEVRLRKASVNLFKQILCLFPLPARVQMGALWLLMSLYSRGWSGLPGHMSGSNKTGWHHFTHCYQDVICFLFSEAPPGHFKGLIIQWRYCCNVAPQPSKGLYSCEIVAASQKPLPGRLWRKTNQATTQQTCWNPYRAGKPNAGAKDS